MKPLIRRAEERGSFKNRWLDTHYTFSFADYEDPAWMGFRTLRVMNEDRVAPGKGFDLHGHRDMEILTYVMQGALRHVDTMGDRPGLPAGTIVKAGEFQLMTAGAGVQHMELNASQTEECHLYQIWILPNARNLPPSYEQKDFSNHPGEGRGPRSNDGRTLIASPDARNGSLKIHQDAEVWFWRLEAGETATIEVPAGKGCWIQVVSGEIVIPSEAEGSILRTSDAAGFEETLEIKTLLKSELMVFVV